ncbi:thioredoxin family protein [Dokdonella sp.]|uniref:thioredoxin family protein n=1 Tax=Dokdonella sp. TaxID=2291710 RepID=UPI001B04273A|nr:thioredoxin family protein [Dokdonella sp.]MBO9662253.1 thioredoxin family protein [Dokdonella sp.]
MWKSILVAAATCVAVAVVGMPTPRAEPVVAAPEFTGIDRWFNSAPLSLAELEGKVVLVEFWTYSCINCIHVTPHVKEWYRRYRDQGLVVIGVHTPEYEEEHDPAKVQAAIERFGIEYPVAQDNGYRTWEAYGNRYWPASYLIDREGRIVYRHYGEGAYEVMDERIRQALASR